MRGHACLTNVRQFFDEARGASNYLPSRGPVINNGLRRNKTAKVSSRAREMLTLPISAAASIDRERFQDNYSEVARDISSPA